LTLTLTDPAVLAGDTGALRDVLAGSSCFDFSAFFDVAFEAGAEALGAVFFEEGAPFDFAVAMLVRRDGAALFVSTLFFASFTFSPFFSRLTELVDFRGAGAGSDFDFAFEALFRFSSAVDLLFFFFSAAVDLVMAFSFASLIPFSFLARRAELVVGFFGTDFSLVDRAFLEVLLDGVDFFEDEADGLALDVEAGFSMDFRFVFADEVFGGSPLAEAIESRALAAALGLLLSLKGLLFFAFVSADFFAAATFTFSTVDCGQSSTMA